MKSDESWLKKFGCKNVLQNAECKNKLKQHAAKCFFENNLMKNMIS